MLVIRAFRVILTPNFLKNGGVEGREHGVALGRGVNLREENFL
ncbi:MAG: hypothetical protein K0S56_4347, partial [Microvirga sp.]|nr:hypothetical protein [Microvirga sp.]